MSILSAATSLSLGIIFLIGCIDKTIHFNQHVKEIEAYKIFKGREVLVSSLSLLLFIEYILSLALLSLNPHLIFLVISIIIQILYTTMIIKNLLSGNKNISCGCGGLLKSDKLSWNLILRNIVFIIALLAIEVFKTSVIITKVSNAYMTVLLSIITFMLLLIFQNIIKAEHIRR